MEKEINKCERCHKVFSTKGNLNSHKRTNTKCLKLYGDMLAIESGSKVCKYCDKRFTKINIHKCKNEWKYKNDELQVILQKLKEELEILKNEKENFERMKNEEVKLLEQEVSIFKKMFEEKDSVVTKLALQPKMSTNTNTNTNTTNTTTTMYNNLSVFDVEEITRRLEEKMETVEYSDLLEGQKSLAKIVGPCLKNEDGKSMYICSDPSRFVFCTKNSSGEILRDQGGAKILNLTNGIVVPKAKDKLYSEQCPITRICFLIS